MSSEIDFDKTKKRLSEILHNIQSEADPVVLNEYRSILRREVSFFRRSYVAAYLLMQLEQDGEGRFQGSRKRKNGRFQGGRDGSSSGDDSGRQEQTRYPLPEEESTRLFISIGRNRKVFPREILGLISSKTAVSKDDIGNIKIFDNYSFVQVRTTVADEIIEALNGKPFRGRTLAVNFARSKKEDEAETGESADDGAEE